MSPNVITHQTDLIAFVERISSSPWLALDTEFMRESTYYPVLCLIQIATENTSACIDVLSLEHIDPLLALLKKSNQHKIFHSCRQDLEVFYATYKFIPQPLFDTQVAASILGLDEQISYAELVAQTCAIQLPKTESRTDWKKRPLTKAQIDYALDDVNHLGTLYSQLHKQLQNKNRTHWLQEECDQLVIEDNYTVKPENAWKAVKGIGKLNATQFYYLRKLAAWREASAQTKNLPRRWLLPDPVMLELTQLKTINTTTIGECIKELAPKSMRHREVVTEILLQSIPDTQTEHLFEPEDNRLSKDQRQLIKKLMQITRNKALEMETSASLLANRKSLVNLVLGKHSKVSSGWRKDQIGHDLQAVIHSET